jgi:hypothetical protein
VLAITLTLSLGVSQIGDPALEVDVFSLAKLAHAKKGKIITEDTIKKIILQCVR